MSEKFTHGQENSHESSADFLRRMRKVLEGIAEEGE